MNAKDEQGVSLMNLKKQQELDSLEYNDDDLEDVDFLSKHDATPSLASKEDTGWMTKIADVVINGIVWIQYQWIFNRFLFVMGCIASVLILLMITGIVERFEGPKNSLGGLFTNHYDSHIDHIPYWTTIKSKMDLQRDKIEKWCLDGRNDCDCADPMIAEAKFNNREWRKASKRNRKEVQSVVNEKYQALYNHKEEEEKDKNDESFAEELTQETTFRKVDVVFLGDSITEARAGRQMGKESDSLKSTKKIFDEQFHSTNSTFIGMALGIAGDTVPNLLYRIKYGGEVHLDMDPKVYWITIGINDLLAAQCSDEVVLVGIINLVEELKILKPKSYIVINSILPMNQKDFAMQDKDGNKNGLWGGICSINDALHKFAKNTKKVKFFDAKKIFTTEHDDGSLYSREDLYDDSVHPSRKGHKQWGKKQIKFLEELIGEEDVPDVDSTPANDDPYYYNPLEDDTYPTDDTYPV